MLTQLRYARNQLRPIQRDIGEMSKAEILDRVQRAIESLASCIEGAEIDEREEAAYQERCKEQRDGFAAARKSADNEYQPTTGKKCGCIPGVQRNNCPHCEGTGNVIDFVAIRQQHQR